jgi:hypothetical protein
MAMWAKVAKSCTRWRRDGAKRARPMPVGAESKAKESGVWDSRPTKGVLVSEKGPLFPNKGDDGSQFVRDDDGDTTGRGLTAGRSVRANGRGIPGEG